MLTAEEVQEASNRVTTQNNFLMATVNDQSERMRHLCATFGISAEDISGVVDYIVETHYPMPKEVVYEFQPQVAFALVHGILCGLSMGERIEEVRRTNETEDERTAALITGLRDEIQKAQREVRTWMLASISHHGSTSDAAVCDYCTDPFFGRSPGEQKNGD